LLSLRTQVASDELLDLGVEELFAAIGSARCAHGHHSDPSVPSSMADGNWEPLLIGHQNAPAAAALSALQGSVAEHHAAGDDRRVLLCSADVPRATADMDIRPAVRAEVVRRIDVRPILLYA